MKKIHKRILGWALLICAIVALFFAGISNPDYKVATIISSCVIGGGCFIAFIVWLLTSD